MASFNEDRFDRVAGQLRDLQGQGADIVFSDTSIGSGQMTGWRDLVGGELLPAFIVWQPGRDVAYLWSDECDATTPGHDTHGTPFTLMRPARTYYDVVASLLYDNDDLAWLTERIAPMIV